MRYIVLPMLRTLASLVLAAAFYPAVADRILLIPLDSRPATGQFAQLIGSIASVPVEMPPAEVLGRFTSPGQPEAVAAWLSEQDFSGVIAVVVSADMLAYGGLVESRVPSVPTDKAIQRLQALTALRDRFPNLTIYACSALMRTAPTATRESAPWRMQLARYVEFKEKLDRTNKRGLRTSLSRLQSQIPRRELDGYWEARKRNMAVHKELIRLTQQRVINYLVIGADDAQKYGPHYPETLELRRNVRARGVDGLVYFCEGVDQHANLLVSRALLRSRGWTPHVYVRLSNPTAATQPTTYETRPLSHSIRDQIIASGARPAPSPKAADYSLYLNTPGTTDSKFASFAFGIKSSFSKDKSVAVADVNFDKKGSGDARLIAQLWKYDQAGDLLAFAGWNTAGNTLGTAIPQANIYLLARRSNENAEERETAQRVFLLHRFINDYGYHKYVRPAAYKIIDSYPGGAREEAYGTAFASLQKSVARQTKNLLQKYFKEQFSGSTFEANGASYRIRQLSDVEVSLPWPRAFEVRIDFDFVVEPAPSSQKAQNSESKKNGG